MLVGSVQNKQRVLKLEFDRCCSKPPVHTVNLSRMETPQPSKVTPEPLKRGTEPLKKGMEPLEMDRNRYKRIRTVKK